MQPFFIFQMVIQSNPSKQENKLEQKRLFISSLINIAPLFAEILSLLGPKAPPSCVNNE